MVGLEETQESPPQGGTQEGHPNQSLPELDTTMTTVDITRRRRPEMQKEQLLHILGGTFAFFVVIIVTLLFRGSAGQPDQTPVIDEAVREIEKQHDGQQIEVLSESIRRGKRYGEFWIYRVKMRYRMKETRMVFEKTV